MFFTLVLLNCCTRGLLPFLQSYQALSLGKKHYSFIHSLLFGFLCQRKFPIVYKMERTPLRTRGWGIFWSGFCLSLSFRSFSAVRWPFRWHSQCLSRPGESSPDYNVRASLLWDLFGSGTQHPHHSGSDHPACCLPLRLLMWLLPADPLYCLGKRAGTSAADRWDSHRTIPRWPKQLCFPGVSKVMTKSITAREACS